MVRKLISFLKDPFSSKVIAKIKANNVELRRLETQKMFGEEWNKLIKNR